MKVTIVEVAKAAQVSVATVSRVMNGNYPVSERTREKVMKAIEDLNFIPNLQARELNQKVSSTIGVIVPSVENMFFSELITGIETYLKKMNYSMLLSCSKNSKEKEVECVNDLLARNVAGIIIADPNNKTVVSAFYDMISKRIPIVFINGNIHHTQFFHVCSDEEGGTWNALQYLLEHHHEEIGFIRGENSYSYDVKQKVFDRRMLELGKNSEEYTIIVNNGNNVSVIDETEEVCVDILTKKKFTALFAANDLMAIGAINACKKIGLRVPQDVSVIGFDNILLSRYVDPKLTTVDQNTFLLGYNSAQLLIEKINSKDAYNKKIILNTTLVERDTVCDRLGGE